MITREPNLDVFHPTAGVPHFYDKEENGPNYTVVEILNRADLLLEGKNCSASFRIDDREEKVVKELLLQFLAKPGLSSPKITIIVKVGMVEFRDCPASVEELLSDIKDITADFRAPEKSENPVAG